MASLARRMLVAGTVALAVSALPAARAQTSATCTGRLLVLSAFPAEIGPLLARTTLTSTEVVDGRQFFVGTLEGNKVVLALTGIGLVNADNTTRMALDRFGCGSKRAIKGIVLSGVSGGHTYIGDVTVPARWTLDDGKTWYAADRTMLAAAKGAIAAGVSLKSDTPVGDCACTGADPDAATVVHLSHTPEILFGGDGRSSDPFGGRAFPCSPQGGDVFGCQPCRARNVDPQDVARFSSGVAPFLDPSFFLGYLQAPPATPAGFDADDMETAAVARVASQRSIPFIGFRSLSDGLGDPLMLPGFPAQFFVYRQLAAENAAAVALAFLRGWAAR